MKLLRPSFLGGMGVLLVAILMLTSCNKSNQVVSDNFIQKRKYRQGFHLNHGHQRNQHIAQVKTQKDQSVDESDTETPGLIDAVPSVAPKPSTISKADQIRSVRLPGLGNVEFTSNKRNAALRFFENIETTIDRKQHELKPVDSSMGDETEDKVQEQGNIALIAGILAWVISIGGGVLGLVIPFVGLFTGVISLIAAIVALIYGSRSKKESTAGLIGFILGLVYIILAVLTIILIVLIIAIFIAAFA